MIFGISFYVTASSILTLNKFYLKFQVIDLKYKQLTAKPQTLIKIGFSKTLNPKP